MRKHKAVTITLKGRHSIDGKALAGITGSNNGSSNLREAQADKNAIRWHPGERLNHYFEERCDRVPSDHLAVVTEDIQLSFRQLDDRANQAARFLIEQGLKPGDRVGVLFDKSMHGYVALLAIMKLGAGYVPLDAAFPPDRMAYIVQDASVNTVVSVTRFRKALSNFPARVVFMDEVSALIDAKSTSRLDPKEQPSPDADQLFYIIYTSGTTGTPKGVAIDHAGICNFVKVAGEVYGYTENDRCYQGMSLAFDFHVEDLWTPLISGVTLVAGKSGASLFGADLHSFLKEHRVTILPCVPTLWATIEEDLPDVRIIQLSGEAVPHNLVAKWYREDRRILNAYGPTECSVSSTLKVLTPGTPVTIGTPLPTYTAVVLDEDKPAQVAKGAIGEIGIAGICEARGYLNREDLTAQKFIPDFLNLPNNPSGRIYRTGDYGRVRDDGEIEFHGRIDTQVKLRGYRIELGEIETVLTQIPEIAQAVVNPHETAPGTTELVAYYTRKAGSAELSLLEVAGSLRRQLPPYMVPGYLEELDYIPMTTNHKADRKALPNPKGPRFSVSTVAFEEPRSDIEIELSKALAAVMSIERISVTADFFQDLGAHSLLMARFGAEIRKRLDIPNVSIRDIYLHPTLEKLGKHIESLTSDPSNEPVNVRSNQEGHYVPSNRAYWLCGTLQAAWLLCSAATTLLSAALIVQWMYAAVPDLGLAYLRAIVVTFGIAVFSAVIPVVGKWTLIGRFKEQTIPVWSMRYFRFWIVKSLIRSTPVNLVRGPLYNAYLRLLGAKVGKNALIRVRQVPVCTDLISVGRNSVIGKDSVLTGYKAQSNLIFIGRISIGDNAFTGEGCVFDVNTGMEDNTQLGHASSLHEGQCVPQGKHYHGCPAQETSADYRKIAPRTCSALRRWTYALTQIVTVFAFGPLIMLLGLVLIPSLFNIEGGPALSADVTAERLLFLAGAHMALSLGSYLGAVTAGILLMGIIPRLLNYFIKPDKEYVLYGFHYFIHHTIERLSNSRFYNNLFGDSSYSVHYMRWVGWNLNKVIQTGSNFGADQRHDNPFLVSIGSGTMVSGGLKIINEVISSSSFRLSKVSVGEYNYLGNYVRIPADSKVGANVLVGTKMLVPIDGPIRENVGLLGSPCFEIPRAAQRDAEMSSRLDDEARRRRLRAKLHYNICSSALFLLVNWFNLYGLTLIGIASAALYPDYGVSAVILGSVAALTFLVSWGYFIERSSLKFGRLRPQIALVLDPYYWFHERHKLISLLHLLEGPVAGTPFKNLVSRLEGVKIGRKVFDDGFEFNEYTLIQIGDLTNLNAGGLIQPHTLEEAVFKSDFVKIGKGCTLHTASNIHYGVTFGDYVVLEPNTFVMKGEIAESDTTWRGNPARSMSSRPARKAALPG